MFLPVQEVGEVSLTEADHTTDDDWAYFSLSAVFSDDFNGGPTKHKELEIWHRAQLEAARRPKSDWKHNLGGCMACKSLRGNNP